MHFANYGNYSEHFNYNRLLYYATPDKAEELFQENYPVSNSYYRWSHANNILVWILGLVAFFFMTFLFEMDEKQQGN